MLSVAAPGPCPVCRGARGAVSCSAVLCGASSTAAESRYRPDGPCERRRHCAELSAAVGERRRHSLQPVPRHDRAPHPGRHHRRRPGRAAARPAAAPRRHRQRHRSSARAATTCSAASAPACSSRPRSTCSTRPASARACTPRAWCTTASSCASAARATASTCTALTGGKHVDRLRPDRGHARPDGRARSRRAGDRLRGRATWRCTTSTAPRRSVTYTQGRRGARAATATSSPAATATTASSRASVPPAALSIYEKVYPFGWLGVLADMPPVVARADLREPRARLRAVLDALADAQPLLRPVPAARQGRGLERRRASGTSCAAGSTREAAEALVTGPSIEKSIAPLRSFVAEPMRFGTPVPGRRRRAHRAADRRQGAEPGGVGRALPVARADRALPRQERRRHRRATPSAAWRASGRPSASRGGSPR